MNKPRIKQNAEGLWQCSWERCDGYFSAKAGDSAIAYYSCVLQYLSCPGALKITLVSQGWVLPKEVKGVLYT